MSDYRLPREDLEFLAREVMGLQKIGHQEFYQLMYLQQPPGTEPKLTGFYCVTAFHRPQEDVYIQLPNDEQWREFSPDTDEGDAARLFRKLPFAILENIGKERVSVRLPFVFGWIEPENDFCTAVCKAGLLYAKHKVANEQHN